VLKNLVNIDQLFKDNEYYLRIADECHKYTI